MKKLLLLLIVLVGGCSDPEFTSPDASTDTGNRKATEVCYSYIGDGGCGNEIYGSVYTCIRELSYACTEESLEGVTECFLARDQCSKDCFPECAQGTLPDAGIPDASAPDASTSDAAPNADSMEELLCSGVRDGHCYKLFTQKFNWWDAYSVCSGWGGYPATPSSPAENEFVAKLVGSRDSWIGLHVGEDEWEDGTPLTFQNWAFPEEYQESGECAKYYSNGFWYSDDCTKRRTFVCEQPY